LQKSFSVSCWFFVRAFWRNNGINGLACGRNVHFRGGPMPT